MSAQVIKRLLAPGVILVAAMLLAAQADIPADSRTDTQADAQTDTQARAPASSGSGFDLVIEGPIGPATSAYISDELTEAQRSNAELVLLRIDTPGGLDTAMREIVQDILASPVPVVGYVSPSGARAASAGTYILYATHIAAMAPATNLGAATPVSLGGGGSPAAEEGESKDKGDSKDQSDAEKPSADNESAKRRKVVNDAVAYIRGLAEKRGRNADWAESAVRDGESISATQALELDVIDLIADNPQELLAAINQQEVQTVAGSKTLNTDGLALQTREPDWRMRLLAVVTNPTVAYILMMIGIYGLILEGYSPGAMVPGVVGGISLLIALFAFQIIPVNFAGFGLLLLGVALMIAEAFAPSFGVLGLGGVAAFVFGSIMLMDTGVPGYTAPIAIIAAIATAAALTMLLVIWLFLRSRQQQVTTGREGLVNTRAQALEDFENQGWVLVHGERWRATSAASVRSGDSLQVTAVDGLMLRVKPWTRGETAND